MRLTPLAGLGIGEQIGWLTRHARSCEDYHQQHRAAARAGRGHGWLRADHGLVYTGSITAQHGQPVVDLTEAAGSTTASLLGVELPERHPGQRGPTAQRASRSLTPPHRR